MANETFVTSSMTSSVSIRPIDHQLYKKSISKLKPMLQKSSRRRKKKSNEEEIQKIKIILHSFKFKYFMLVTSENKDFSNSFLIQMSVFEIQKKLLILQYHIFLPPPRKLTSKSSNTMNILYTFQSQFSNEISSIYSLVFSCIVAQKKCSLYFRYTFT